MKNIKLAFLFATVVVFGHAHAFSFTPSSFYSTSDNAVNQYDSTGKFLGSMNYSGTNLRGLSFGPDGDLYVVRDGRAYSNAFVDVLRDDGSLVHSYSFTGALTGNISFGKIAFDPLGKNFYVGAGNGVYKFNVGASTGSLFVNQDAYDINTLPNGDLIVATDYNLYRYSSSGAQSGSISFLSDPNHLTGDNYGPRLVNVRGVQYDPSSNKLFVTMLGYTGYSINMSFKVLTLDGFSNVVTGLENYWYGDDMALTDTGRLIVGSRTQAPGLFLTSSLQYLGQFSGPDARFVTALPVPEPSNYMMMLAGLGLLGFSARRKSQWIALI